MPSFFVASFCVIIAAELIRIPLEKFPRFWGSADLAIEIIA